MDPDANWTEQCALRARGALGPDDRARLAELADALREWLRKGGFRPAAWGNR